MVASCFHKEVRGNCGQLYTYSTFYCNGTGCEYTESEEMCTVGKRQHYAFIKKRYLWLYTNATVLL